MSQPSPSVYVGDLDPQVTEALLYDHFKNCGPVLSVRVCMDSQTHKSLGYGYVNFQNAADAENALENMNGSKLFNRCIRVARIQRDPTARRAGVNNIVVKHLPNSVEMSGVKDLFKHYGRITSIKVATDETGKSRGYAYITFENEEACKTAVDNMNGMEVEGQQIIVERYNTQHRSEMAQNFSNLYIKHLNKNVTEDGLRAAFSAFGEITSLKIRVDPATGQSKGFGYVAFKDHPAAQTALDTLDGKPHETLAAEGEQLCVRRFESKKERARKREMQWRERQAQYAKYPNLYVKNLEDHVNSDRLKEVFELHGPTESVRVMADRETGLSRGFGFVSYRDHASAQKAITALAGSTILGSRPLYVTYAMKRDARRQQFEELQKKRQQRSLQMSYGGGGPQMGGYGGPQMPPFGGMGGPSMGGMGGGMGGHMGPGPAHGGPGPMAGRMPPHMMMMQRGGPPNMGVPQGFGAGHGAQPGMGGMPGLGIPPQRVQRPQPKPSMMHMPPQAQPVQQHQPLSTLLANMSVDQQKNVLGERLYAHISRSHSSEAAKITGMLLEMDITEILNLLEAPMLLDEKVNEALDVLRQHSSY